MTFLVWGIFFFTLGQLGFKYNSLEFWVVVCSVAAIMVEDSIRRDREQKKEAPKDAS
jgi:ascorbate-specific PTS system EIIC-type component UlaA